MLYRQNATDLVWGTKRRFSKLALISMTLLWHEILVFVTSFLFGTVFLDVFLTMYERSRAEAASAGTQRIFRWSIRGGIGIGVVKARAVANTKQGSLVADQRRSLKHS